MIWSVERRRLKTFTIRDITAANGYYSRMRYKLGISTCPNDTFMFHALLEGRVKCDGFELDIELMDVQQLNERLAQGALNLSKASCYAAALLEERYEVVPAGAALGFRVGPLLLSRSGAVEDISRARVLAPGSMTTAFLLFQRYFPTASDISHAVFSEIMPALERGDADYGVVIHEGRFTYQERGLSLVADLGSLWEREFSLPLPLGCIVADRSLPQAHRESFAVGVRKSIEYAYAHRDEALVTMRRYAQELSDEVIWRHVDLYVNTWSLDLCADGSAALRQFRELVGAYGSGGAGYDRP